MLIARINTSGLSDFDDSKYYSLRNVISLFLVLLIFKTLFEINYAYLLYPIYSYAGYKFNPSVTKYIETSIIFLSVFLLLPNNYRRPSSILLFVIFVITFIPLLSICWLTNELISYCYAEGFCIILIRIILILEPRKMIFHFSARISRILLISTITFYILYTLYFFIKSGGFDYRTLDFSRVYELRGEGDLANGLHSYLLSWNSSALFPLLLTICLNKKKYLVTTIIVLMQILHYSFTGNKTILLSIGFLFLFDLIFYTNHPKQFFVLSLITGLLVSTQYLWTENRVILWIMALIPMRFLAIPAVNQFDYYTFFSINNHLFYSEGRLGELFGTYYKFDQPVGFIISDYFYDIVSNSNTGMFSYGYADYGIIGMIIVSLTIAILFLGIDSFAKDSLSRPYIMIFVYSIVQMNDKALQTVILTGGLIILVLLTLIFKDYIDIKKQRILSFSLYSKNNTITPFLKS